MEHSVDNIPMIKEEIGGMNEDGSMMAFPKECEFRSMPTVLEVLINRGDMGENSSERTPSAGNTSSPKAACSPLKIQQIELKPLNVDGCSVKFVNIPKKRKRKQAPLSGLNASTEKLQKCNESGIPDICALWRTKAPHGKTKPILQSIRKIYECTHCAERFKTHEKLTSHRAFQNCNKAGIPDICALWRTKSTRGKSKTKPKLQRTRKIHECTLCAKRFKTSERLTNHRAFHTGERSFVCGECQMCFKYKSNLTKHQKIHTGDKKHACDTCGKRFLTGFERKVHMRTHTGEKPYACEQCEKCFPTKGALRYHMMIHTENPAYECRECDERFWKESGLARHYMLVHMFVRSDVSVASIRAVPDEPTHKCEVCPKSFPYKNMLAAHNKRAHPNYKPFLCTECGKKFKSNITLQSHITTAHSIEKKYPCATCHKRFTEPRQLERHVKETCGKKRKHVCDVCQDSFKQKSTLEHHMRIHRGEKPFLCQDCGKSFRGLSEMTTHIMRIHNGEKHHSCDICGKRFFKKSVVTLHRVRVHPKDIGMSK